jgi:catechol 2,3-dioxygenase-like lactoylglutathione lyase family enzyme
MFTNSRPIATLPASDIDRAMTWYEDKLGLKPTALAEGGAFYTPEGATFALYPSEYAGKNPATAVAFIVDNIDAAVEHLRDRGVVFEDVDLGGDKPADGVVTTPDGTKAAWFKDSEGNILAVSNRKI